MADIFDLQNDLHRSQAQRDGRYWGVVSGIITNVSDSQGLLRVKARLGGQFDNEESDWLVPALPGAMECKPNKSDPVLVGFVDGDPHRGWWTYHPESTTKNRPTEAMVLGTTLIGMNNFWVTQFNQLRTDFNSFVSTYNGHTHGYNPGPSALAQTVATAAVGTSTTAQPANKGKAGDGSVVPDKSTSEIVLSGVIKVR